MKSKSIKLPKLGRILVAREQSGQGAGMLGTTGFDTNLSVTVFRKGQALKAKDVYPFWHRFWNNIPGGESLINLGSGAVTNVGATALANEAVTLASPSGARINTLFLANFHATGTSATVAAATQYKLITISGNGGQTPVAGAQTVSTSSTMAVPIYKTVATIAYTGGEAVTEWGLFTNGTLTSTTGSNASNAYTATTFTAGAGGLTASSSTIQGLQQQIVEPATTTVIGLIQTNSTTVGTLWNNGTTGWWTQAAQTAGSTPGAAELYTLRPIMFDRKQFAAINVLNGDSIQFTYSLTVTSGG